MPHQLNRRRFLRSTLAVLATIAPAAHAAPAKGRKILLRSGWQTVNIGDIAHTPGVLHLLEKHLPDVQVQLWPSKLDNGADAMLARRFPNLKILWTSDEKKAAFKECDFFLHGSGPSLVGSNELIKWHKETGKPLGVYGITTSSISPAQAEVLNHARFFYFRDSLSLQYAQTAGVKCPIMEFGPDGAFATDLRDDPAADRFLKEHDLTPGKFMCVLSRFRITPYWTVPEKKTAYDKAKDERNQSMKEHDHAPIRQGIIDVVKNTDMKILLVPEDVTQVAIGKEMLYDPLPAEIKKRVVWRGRYWLTDEALSTYVRSAGLFGSEMHSPIMAVGNGIPAIVCRWAEQTTKGYMWRDIGLGDWLFHFDEESDLPRVAPAALAMARDPAAAKAKTAKARDFVMGRFARSMGILKDAIGA